MPLPRWWLLTHPCNPSLPPFSPTLSGTPHPLVTSTSVLLVSISLFLPFLSLISPFTFFRLTPVLAIIVGLAVVTFARNREARQETEAPTAYQPINANVHGGSLYGSPSNPKDYTAIPVGYGSLSGSSKWTASDNTEIQRKSFHTTPDISSTPPAVNRWFMLVLFWVIVWVGLGMCCTQKYRYLHFNNTHITGLLTCVCTTSRFF